MTSNELQVRSLITDWAASVRRKDMIGILAFHSDEIVMYDLPGPVQTVGLEAYRETWARFFSWAKDLNIFYIESLEVTAGEDVAFAYALMRCAGSDDEGIEETLQFRLTVGLRKIDAQWIVTHEHHSLPAA